MPEPRKEIIDEANKVKETIIMEKKHTKMDEGLKIIPPERT